MALFTLRRPSLPLKLLGLANCLRGLHTATIPYRGLATSAQSVGWQRIGPHKFMRPLDAIERTMNYAYDDLAPPGFRSQDILTTARIKLDKCLTLDSSLFEALMRRAWARIAFLHPVITSTFCGDRFVYSVPRGELDIQKWLENSFVVKDSTQFQPPGSSNGTAPPSPTLFQDLATVPPDTQPTMYYFRHEKTFALRSPHIYTDGSGTLILLNDFLTELSSLLEGGHALSADIDLMPPEIDSIKNLPHSSIAAANIPAVSIAEMQALLPEFDLNLSREAIQFPTVELKSSSIDPGPGQLQSLKLNVDQTAAIIRSGKQTGLGFTALLHAAILHAGQGIIPETHLTGNDNTHTTLTGFNFRDRCVTGSPNAGERAFTTRVSMWPFKVQLGGDIWETARCLRDQYTTLASRKDLILPASVTFMQEALPRFAHNLDGSFFASFPGDLTRLVQQKYGRIHVQDLGLSLITTTPMMLLVVQSFGGEMEIRLTYSAAHHQDEKVDEFLQLVRSGLDTISD